MTEINIDTSALHSQMRGQEVNYSDIQSLLKTRTEIQKYNESDVIELENFCKIHGILGINFGKMPPARILNILQNKKSCSEHLPSISKKELLYG